jgi:putative hemolysin
MSIFWMMAAMILGCLLALVGGLGIHVIENYNGRRLEAYCRLKRKPHIFGEILDGQEQAFTASIYAMLLGLVLGSLAAGGWFSAKAGVTWHLDQLQAQVSWMSITGWVLGWLMINVLACLWLPRVVVREGSSLFLFHTWPFWRALSQAASPLVIFEKIFSWLGQRISNVPQEEDIEEELLQDEIRTMVQAAQREGVVSDDIPDMIHSVMQLSDIEVEEIMTPRSIVDALNVEQSWDEVLRKIADCRRTRIPVYRSSLDNIIGVLFVKDLLIELARPDNSDLSQKLESILRKPWFVPGKKTVDELLRVFLHNRNHMAIVVDEYHQMIGVVTIEDALEEIVGEISDELDLEEDSQLSYDPATHQVEAEGKVPVERISRLLGMELPESDDYDTIGGLVVHRLSEIPRQGTQVEVDGLRITVLKATKRLVQRVRIEVIDNARS